MVNPVYLFFASRAGTSGALLRWTLSGFVLLAAMEATGSLTIPQLTLPWLLGGWLPEGWPGAVLLAAIGLLLIFGLFTRLCALVLVVCSVGVFGEPAFASAAINSRISEWILFLSIGMALVISGAGRWSMDQRISNFFLPTLN